jgi:uncharacterized protein (TIGR04255 family)
MAFVYKNAPLVESVFEARFPGDLSIETKRDQFQKALKTDFPKLYVPNVVIGKAPALQHYQFRKEDESAKVSLSVNSFAYSCARYPGFEIYKEDLEKVWTIFSDFFDVPTFTRLGVRYINHLLVIRDERGGIPLSHYVNAQLQLTDSFPGEIVNELDFAASCPIPGGELRVLLQNNKRQEGLEVLVLDLDFSRKGMIERDERTPFIDEAHAQIERVFVSLISDDYKKIMEGGSE